MPDRAVRDVEFDPSIDQSCAQPFELQAHDALELRFGQGLEDDRLVDAIQELGPEVPPQFVEHRGAHDRVFRAAARPREIEDAVAADVRGHDQDRVLEIDRAALTVRQAAVVEDLQEDVEHVRCGLLDLVEEHDGERPAAHGFRELTARIVADVSGRRADQPRDRMLLAVLGHVDAHHRAFVVEQITRERARQLRLAHARGSEEDERADRPVRIGEAAARANDRFRDGRDRLVLADDALVQFFVEPQEFAHLALQQFRDGYARPTAHDVGHVLFGDFFFDQPRLAAGHRLFGIFELAFEFGEPPVAQRRGAIEIVLPLGLFDFDARLIDLLAHGAQIRNRIFLRLPARRDAVRLRAQFGDLAFDA